MTADEILAAVDAGTLLPDEAIRQLVALGIDEREAAFEVGIQTGQIKGDLVNLDETAQGDKGLLP